jgi:hypothetical protein
VTGPVDAFLKVSVALTLLSAAGMGYYHSVYLPAQASQLGREARLSEARRAVGSGNSR